MNSQCFIIVSYNLLKIFLVMNIPKDPQINPFNIFLKHMFIFDTIY